MSERIVRVLQIAGAALAIPAAAGGTYSAYQTYFSSTAGCERLKTSIVATMERKVAPETKRTLLRKDVTEFLARCGDDDPDARTIFQAAIHEPEHPSGPSRPAIRTTAAGAVAQPEAAAPSQPRPMAALSIFGTTDERHGWVVLGRREREAKSSWVANFDGHPIDDKTLPPPGTIITAQRMMAVWAEPQYQANDQSKLQNRLPAGACVRVLATRVLPARLWADVAPASCS